MQLWSSEWRNAKVGRDRPMQSDLGLHLLTFSGKRRTKSTKFVNFTIRYEWRPACSPQVSTRVPGLQNVWTIDEISMNNWSNIDEWLIVLWMINQMMNNWWAQSWFIGQNGPKIVIFAKKWKFSAKKTGKFWPKFKVLQNSPNFPPVLIRGRRIQCRK